MLENFILAGPGGRGERVRSIALLHDSQASPGRPSHRSSMLIKTSEWGQAATWNKDTRILIFGSMLGWVISKSSFVVFKAR